ncbi:MAG: glycosyltransferase [Candidatus Binatia bacterium]
MKVSGFTIARRAVTFGYPLEESIRSLLPAVDEYVVAVGDGDDGTWELVAGIGDPKIRAFRTTWDFSQQQWLMLSDETNKALAACTGDWAVYLQADEVLHEAELPALRAALTRYRDTRVETLSFRYHHFYGSYAMVQDDPRRWYRRATRALKTGHDIYAVGDACAFEVRERERWRRPRRADLPLHVYHYGWVQPPELMRHRMHNRDRLFRGEDWQQPTPAEAIEAYDAVGTLQPFRGSHPAVMRNRIAAQTWRFEPRLAPRPIAWLRRQGWYASWAWSRLQERLRSGGTPR